MEVKSFGDVRDIQVQPYYNELQCPKTVLIIRPASMKSKRSWADVIQTLREQKCQPRLPYPTKLNDFFFLKESQISYPNNNFYVIINKAVGCSVHQSHALPLPSHPIAKAIIHPAVFLFL